MRAFTHYTFLRDMLVDDAIAISRHPRSNYSREICRCIFKYEPDVIWC